MERVVSQQPVTSDTGAAIEFVPAWIAAAIQAAAAPVAATIVAASGA